MLCGIVTENQNTSLGIRESLRDGAMRVTARHLGHKRCERTVDLRTGQFGCCLCHRCEFLQHLPGLDDAGHRRIEMEVVINRIDRIDFRAMHPGLAHAMTQ